jgi:hypothetical protein
MSNPRLTPGEQAVFERVYPLLNQIAEEMQAHVDYIAFCGLARRLASRGYELEELQTALTRHFAHQHEYEGQQCRKTLQ